MSTAPPPNEPTADAAVDAGAADARRKLQDRRFAELLLSVDPFVNLFNHVSQRDDKPMSTNGTTEVVIANKDLRRLAYAAADATAAHAALEGHAAQPGPEAPSLPDPHGCNACTHPHCGRFDGPQNVECRAMAENVWARKDQPEPPQRDAINISTGPIEQAGGFHDPVWGEPGEPPSIQALRDAMALQDMSIAGTLEAEQGSDRMRKAKQAWERACTPHAVQWLLENTTSPKNTQASEILQSLGWTCIGGQWGEYRAATATLAQRCADGHVDHAAGVSNMVTTDGHAALGWTSEEIEEVIACLDDDAANMLAENPEDERAPIMQRAACMVQVFSTLATSASAHQETHRLQSGGTELQSEQEREELIRLRGEHPVMQRLMGELLGVVLTVDGEGDDEEAELQALVKRTRNALAGLEMRTGSEARAALVRARNF